MSCVARSYPRAEFEYQAFHEYDFDKKPQRKSKKFEIEDAWNYAKSWYEYHISKFKDVSFEDFGFIHSVLYKEVIPDKDGKLPSGYKNMYAFANMLGGDLDKYVSHRAKAFLSWLNSDAGRWFIHNIREEANVKRRIALANALASYYIKTFYPYSIEGAMNKYLEFEHKYVGKHVYRLWSNPLFWASFGVGMATWEEIQRLRKVNDYMRFIVSDPVASEVFIQEMRSWWDATNNLTDWDRQINRFINSIKDFITSGGIISTIAGDVGSAIVAETLRRGVVVGLEALGFLLMNFTLAGRLGRGALALAKFIDKSVLSFLGFQIGIEWPVDGKIQMWLNGYLERVFDSNFNPNRLVLDPSEIEELKKNTNIPDKWGGLTKYEWAELYKIVKALYFGEFYLTPQGRQRLTELLDKADPRFVNALRLKLRSMKISQLWRKELIEKFKNANKKARKGFVDCKTGDYSLISDVKGAIRDIVKTVNNNTDFSGVVLPANFDDNQANIYLNEYEHFSGSLLINQYVNSNSYHYSYAYDLGFNIFSSVWCSSGFDFFLARWKSGGESGLSYSVSYGSYNYQNFSSQAYATNYFLLDLVYKLAYTNAIGIRDAKIVKKQDMYYLLLRAESLSSYRLVDGKLRKKTRKTHYLIPLSEVVGYGYYQVRETYNEYKASGNSNSLGLRPDPQKANRFLLANFSILVAGWYFDNNAVEYTIGYHASRGGGGSKSISYYESKEKSVSVNCELIFNPDATDRKKRVVLRLEIRLVNRHVGNFSYSSSFKLWRHTEDFVNYFPKLFVRGEVEETSDAKDFKTHDLDIYEEKILEIPLASDNLTDEEISNYFDPPSLDRDYYDVPEPYSDFEFSSSCFLSI